MTGPDSVVRGVYLGARIPMAHKQRILNAFAGSDVDVWSMTIDGYDHDWERIPNPARRKTGSRKKRILKKKPKKAGRK
jgi:hypothetical protein